MALSWVTVFPAVSGLARERMGPVPLAPQRHSRPCWMVRSAYQQVCPFGCSRCRPSIRAQRQLKRTCMADWQKISRGLSNISVGSRTNVWGVNGSNQIYRYTGHDAKPLNRDPRQRGRHRRGRRRHRVVRQLRQRHLPLHRRPAELTPDTPQHDEGPGCSRPGPSIWHTRARGGSQRGIEPFTENMTVTP
ncbi:tectonin domain-containing protein [Streptomyces sp. NPDC017993]|uniref:tectonin domain-containing protein n=1 Tax=Streptomyces sp. NPDC017993 TaxID=3365027 RepID=UPI0037A6BCAF